MLTRVVEAISRYNMFTPGQRVGIAVSGGADSVCLLHVLVELAPRWALQLSVLHMDHCLRGEESAKDAEFVRRLADDFGLPFHSRRVDVGRLRSESGENLEQAAREARREFFLGFLRSGEMDRIALGHTRSDQAETVLFRLLRGSGTAGLSGILPVTREGLVRPLIEIDRQDVEQFLRERGVDWRDDATNRDLTFARNRIRLELLPTLRRDWNPALNESLARMATISLDDEEYWEAEMDRMTEVHVVRKSGGILIRAGALQELPRAVGRRLIRRALRMVKGDLRRVNFVHVDQVLALALRREGDGRAQLPGVDVMRSFDWIRFAPVAGLAGAPRNYRIPLMVPGEVTVPGSGSRLRVGLGEATQLKESPDTDCRYNTNEWALDWRKISQPLELRNWRQGDQYRPVEHTVEERIKVLFQRARIPLWERRSWPVIVSGETIVWARRFGPAIQFAVTPESRTVLKVGEIEECGDSANLAPDFRRLNSS